MRTIIRFTAIICTVAFIHIHASDSSVHTGLEVSPIQEKITEQSKQEGRTQIDWKQQKYYRDRIEILTHTWTDPEGTGKFNVHLFGITPVNLKTGRIALAIWFKNGKIISILSGPALDGLQFELADLTKDGQPDFLRITKRDGGKTIEAFTIINGIIEPVPDDVLVRFAEKEFFYDIEIPKLIRQRIEQGDSGNRSPRRS